MAVASGRMSETMFNPFVDNETTAETDESLVERAKTGDREA